MFDNLFGRNLFLGSNFCGATSSRQCVKQPLFAKQRLASKSIATLRSSHLDIPSTPAMSPPARLQMLLGGVQLGKKLLFYVKSKINKIILYRNYRYIAVWRWPTLVEWFFLLKTMPSGTNLISILQLLRMRSLKRTGLRAMVP